MLIIKGTNRGTVINGISSRPMRCVLSARRSKYRSIKKSIRINRMLISANLSSLLVPWSGQPDTFFLLLDTRIYAWARRTIIYKSAIFWSGWTLLSTGITQNCLHNSACRDYWSWFRILQIFFLSNLVVYADYMDWNLADESLWAENHHNKA